MTRNLLFVVIGLFFSANINSIQARSVNTKHIANLPAPVLPDTIIMPVNVGGPNAGDWGGGPYYVIYRLSFNQVRNMPPGDQFYIESSTYENCNGQSTPWHKLIGSHPVNWYNDTVNKVFTGSTNGTVHSSVDIGSSAFCSVAFISFRIVYISAAGNGTVHATITNVIQDLAATHIISAGVVQNGNACLLPVTANMGMSVICTQCPSASNFVSFSFGDGTDTSFIDSHPFPYKSYSVSHTYKYSGIFSPVISISGESRVFWNSVVIQPDSCQNIGGRVYADINGDCIKSFTEPGPLNLPVYISNTNGDPPHVTFTNNSGQYRFPAAAGTYGVYVLNPYYAPACPSNYIVSGFPSLQNHFGIDSSCASQADLDVHLSVRGLVPGKQALINLNATNKLCSSVSSNIRVVLPQGLTYISADKTPSMIIGDTLIWNKTLDFSHQYKNSITVLCSTSLLPGDTLCIPATVNSTAMTEWNPADNQFLLCTNVMTSAAANVKTVTPSVTNVDGTVPHSASFFYTIHFQNKETSTTRNIIILDTLSANLDISTFRVIGGSHSFRPEIMNGNVLKVRFDSIMLATGKQGYFSYEIMPLATAANLSAINNKAFILYDYVRQKTNTVSSVVNARMMNPGIETIDYLEVSPNPVTGMLTVSLLQKDDYLFTLYNSAGKCIFKQQESQTHQINLDMEPYPAGLYIVVLNRSDGTTFSRKIIRSK